MTASSSLLAILIAFLIIHFLRGGANDERAQQTPVGTIFLTRKKLKFASSSVIAICVAILVFGLTQRPREEDIVWFGAVFLVVSVLSIPSRIIVSHAGVRKLWVAGLVAREIQWKDAEYLLVDAVRDEAELIGKNGKAIKHSPDHVDRPEFVALAGARIPVRSTEYQPLTK